MSEKSKFKKALEAFLKELKGENFAEEKLNDGTTVISYEAEKLDVGVAVMAVTESGKLPLPDGDYVTESGTEFNVANGAVTAVKEAAVAEEGADGAPPAAANMGAPAAQPQAVKSIVESVIKESRFQEQLDEFKTQIEEFTKAKEAFATQKESDSKKIADLEAEVNKNKETLLKAVELLNQIAEEPSATATDKDKPKPTAKVKTAKELSEEFKNALKFTKK